MHQCDHLTAICGKTFPVTSILHRQTTWFKTHSETTTSAFACRCPRTELWCSGIWGRLSTVISTPGTLGLFQKTPHFSLAVQTAKTVILVVIGDRAYLTRNWSWRLLFFSEQLTLFSPGCKEKGLFKCSIKWPDPQEWSPWSTSTGQGELEGKQHGRQVWRSKRVSDACSPSPPDSSPLFLALLSITEWPRNGSYYDFIN